MTDTYEHPKCIDCQRSRAPYDDLNWVPNRKWTCNEQDEETRCRCGCDKMVTVDDPCGRCKSCQFAYVKTVELQKCLCCHYDFVSVNGAMDCDSCIEWALHFCTVCKKNYDCTCMNEFGKCDGCQRFCACPCTILSENVKKQREMDQQQLEAECAEYQAWFLKEEGTCTICNMSKNNDYHWHMYEPYRGYCRAICYQEVCPCFTVFESPELFAEHARTCAAYQEELNPRIHTCPGCNETRWCPNWEEYRGRGCECNDADCPIEWCNECIRDGRI